MILSSFKIYTDIGKLEPTTRNNLDWFGFGFWKHKIHALKHEIYPYKDHERDEPIQTYLDWAKVLHESKHKVKTWSNTG
jgi:hypothetical protein